MYTPPPPPSIHQYIYPTRPIYRWGIYCDILGVTCMRGGGENSGGGDAMEGSGLDGILRHARTLSTRDADEYLSQVLPLSTESIHTHTHTHTKRERERERERETERQLSLARRKSCRQCCGGAAAEQSTLTAFSRQPTTRQCPQPTCAQRPMPQRCETSALTSLSASLWGKQHRRRQRGQRASASPSCGPLQVRRLWRLTPKTWQRGPQCKRPTPAAKPQRRGGARTRTTRVWMRCRCCRSDLLLLRQFLYFGSSKASKVSASLSPLRY